MARNPQPRPLVPSAARRGMTLIELILVMGLLAFILTITTPALSNFFVGRRAREEARRFLALTRFARVEAVSRSTPMELWIEGDTYGLRPRLTSEAQNDKLREYQIAEGLRFEFDKTRRSSSSSGNADALILFQPDGTIDDDESLESVFIIDNTEHEMVIERAETGVGYVVLDDEEANLRRR